ncbi:MAG: DUF4091 domain-containing protein [Lentisphaerae bacterium]|nr:DUF4091 domain-containing protein [Lentisphaerota bacterium]
MQRLHPRGNRQGSRRRQILAVAVGIAIEALGATTNLVANPGFEEVTPEGFAKGWDEGGFGKLGVTVALESTGAQAGQHCLRLRGTPNSFTTCAGRRIEVKADCEYWVTWWYRAEQPASSRTYLFLQTNTGQRVFPHTDRHGDVDWTFAMARYRTAPDEHWISPVLTMHTALDQVGASWWDEIRISEALPPDLEAAWRRQQPWDDPPAETTARRLWRGPEAVVWMDQAEARLYPTTPLPSDAAGADAIRMAAPGRGHGLCQVVVTPQADLAPLRLELTAPDGPATLPAEALTARVVRAVAVQETRDRSFPKGPTPDPLVVPSGGETATAGRNVVFWLEWAPPATAPAGDYAAEARLYAGERLLATLPLALRRWSYDLPEVPQCRSMVMLGSGHLRRFYPTLDEDAVLELAWDLLGRHRLSGFNLTIFPAVRVVDGAMTLDWSRFDRILAAAQRHRATALTIGPMIGGGCSEGWMPRFKLAGTTALADPGFDAVYRDLNRQIAERLRAAGCLEMAYVYPYDEPEADYMDKIARLCDLIHEGAPDLKVLMTTDPATGTALGDRVQAWIVPWSRATPDVTGRRRQAGDEIWVYNMIASIESAPLDHRTFFWHALAAEAAGGLLWNACWWNGIDPWENPTAKPVPVGRQRESLYHYSAGQASLFYPAPDGRGPLVPSLRLALIRQGIEDFDLFTSLMQAWQARLTALPDAAAAAAALAAARRDWLAPVVLDALSSTRSADRVEALRQLLAAELEAVTQSPLVIASLGRAADGRLQVRGVAEADTDLALAGHPIALAADGAFSCEVTPEAVADGLRWSAAKGPARKAWSWPGLK